MWTAVQGRRLRPRPECEGEGLPDPESSGVDTREKLLAEVWE